MEFVLLHTYIDKENIIMKEYCMRQIFMLSTYSVLIISHLSCMHSKYKNKMILLYYKIQYENFTSFLI